MPAAIQIVNSQNGSPIYVRVYRASLEAGQLTPWRRHAFQQVTKKDGETQRRTSEEANVDYYHC